MGVGFFQSSFISLKCLDEIQADKTYIPDLQNRQLTDVEYLGWATLCCFNDQEIFCLGV